MQHSSQLADGELDKASETMEQVLQLRDDMNNARMRRAADNARDSAKLEIRYDATVDRLEAAYPVINPDSDDFDEETVQSVQALTSGYMQSQGLDAASALEKATDVLLKPKYEEEKRALRDKPSDEVAEKGLRRQAAQVQKNVDTAKAQPPATDQVGSAHDTAGSHTIGPDFAQMSFDEFLKMPEEELSKHRGDHL